MYLTPLIIIKNKIKKRISFDFNEIQQEIIEKGGVLRISPGFTIGMYINELEEDGIIKFDPDSKKYKVIK